MRLINRKCVFACARSFGFFFEQGATSFQHSDPEAAAYFKWAARCMWRNMAVRDDFGSFYWTPALAYAEELQQLANGGPIPTPDLVDLNSTVVMKSEYQHDDQRQGGCPVSASKLPGLRAGCFPKKLVLCASRKPGSAYVQQDIYAVPPGYHGTAHQAGTMNHYEYGTTLFLEGGSRTKHISQTDASTGMPTLMPDSDAASELFPWRWGQHNIAKGKIQVWQDSGLVFTFAHIPLQPIWTAHPISPDFFHHLSSHTYPPAFTLPAQHTLAFSLSPRPHPYIPGAGVRHSGFWRNGACAIHHERHS